MSDLVTIRAWCQQAKPLFICGLARSGTSMLQVAFARHAELFNIKNCRETHVFVRPRQPLVDPIHVPTKLYLCGREGLMGYRTLVQELQQQEGTLSEDDLISSFFWYASTAVYPGRQPLEKTPGHLKKLPLIFKLFPNASVVVCSRDPLDVMSSYRKRLVKSREEGMDESALKWLDKSAPEMLAVFRRFTKLVDAARPEHGNRMFMAPYEWLVDSPAESLRRVCEFVNIPFDVRMLTKSDDEVPDPDDDYPSRYENISSQISKRESDAHKVLSAEEIELISEGTKPWIEAWRTPGVLG